jgi:probable F420-dependent oxidoreductase
MDEVRFGLHALGIGAGARPDVIRSVAAQAEVAGFATLWSGEHVVMLDRADTPYPYSADGRIAVPSSADWLDPWATLTFAAAATAEIHLATGVLLLPEHNPLIVAKQAASLDVLSAGRLRLGVGIGWSRGEFETLGVPFAGRSLRTREYVEAMRVLWRDDPSSYEGRFVRFDRVRSYPKPLQGHIPVLLGGNSDAALARVAQYGDGWYGFNLASDELSSRLDVLRSACREAGRDARDLAVAVSLKDGHPDHVRDLVALGIDELVLVDSPPADARAASDWVSALAERWGLVDSGKRSARRTAH